MPRMLVGNYRCVFVICSGKQELELKLAAVRLICEYVDVVMWFLSVGLLPEHPGLASVSTVYHRSTPCLCCIYAIQSSRPAKEYACLFWPSLRTLGICSVKNCTN